MLPEQVAADPVEFVVEREVRFGDCDPAGIVFFPNYFRMLNSVVEDWWAALGTPWTSLVSVRRIGTPTVRLDSEFVQPSYFGETLRFHLSVVSLGGSSLTLEHVAIGGDSARMRVRQVMVATSLDTHRSIPWPEDVREAITRFMERR
ncbi:acyl-CoA thioesterase [Cognatazoarcus halotolerans]|uniref:acyl-CoA thioesterase n=1 Tax=Cognatazoarcus halotolerans TaxID=2686016 RepID=UPI00135CA782|nr:thioesterase family protein [Cognatazoarcus halotolerans]MCB1900872.1 acyl-CoA thioesterase [Rhodocyclaceae bacterium]